MLGGIACTIRRKTPSTLQWEVVMLPDEVRLEFETALEPNDMIPLADAWRIAELATKLEREACVKVCRDKAEKLYEHAKGPYMRCAEAIEARGK